MKKLCFCFLTYNDIDQREIWGYFFKDIEPELYSVYIHSKNSITKSWLTSAICIPTIPTKWSNYNLVEAEIFLYEYALQDIDNEMFIFLSGDSIPLYSFKILYDKIINKQGILNGIRTLNQERGKNVKPECLPGTNKYTFLKTQQFKCLSRKYVDIVCKYKDTLKNTFETVVSADQHAIITLFHNLDVLDKLDKTYFFHFNWTDVSNLCTENHRPLPKTYHKNEITSEFISNLKNKGILFLRKICTLEQISPSIITFDK